MHILIEHILTGSTNRPLYESLWNLSISKTVKPNQKFFSDNQSVVEICNQIIQEIKRDNPDRSNFYYSTQISFGCVILYRHQVDKLYTQTRNALQSCTTTFYEINWLTQMAQQAPKQEKQKAGATKKKQNEPNKKSKGKQVAQPEIPIVIDDFDMLEDIFAIGDSPVAPPKKAGKGQKQPLQEIDPTMAVSSNHITILEAKPTDFVRSYNMQQEIAENDFDEDFGSGDKLFDFSFHFSALQHPGGSDNIEPELPASLNSPDELRCASASNRELPLTLLSPGFGEDDPMGEENDSRKKRAPTKRPFPQEEEASTSKRGNYPDAPLTLPEDSLCGDIMNIVSKQMKSRKRKASVDLSTRVEASMGSRLEEPVPDVDVNNNFEFPDDLSLIGVPLMPIASSTPNNSFAKKVSRSEDIEESFENPPPVSPISKAPKKRAQKRKLCVDKATKLPTDSLTQRTTYYKEHIMLPYPLESFDKTFFRIKVSNEPYFTSPSSGLKHAAEVLMSLFNRNLKRVPNALKKRKLPQDDQPEPASPPVKKPRATRKAAAKEATLPINLDPTELPTSLDIEVPVTLDPLEVPSLDELAPQIPEPVELPEFEEIAEQQAFAVPKPPKKAQEVAKPKSTKKANGVTFKESEKWSKAKIMKTLASIWKQKVTAVTMITLCPNTNRFVAAGVFFELMELSKLGAVELIQGEGLQLVDVKPGSNAKAFK